MKDLIHKFEQYFELIPVDSEQLLLSCQQLRYQVFCEEHHILPDDKSGMEHDSYDQRSAHTLLRHRPSGCDAALVRLVLPDPKLAEFSYPMEEHLQTLSPAERNILRRTPRAHTAEISRFSVSKNFRRRPDECRSNHGMTEAFAQPRPSDERRLDSLITLGLFKAIVQMSAEHDISHWLAFMEPSLIRLLARVGIRFTTVGPLIDYCGQRHACVEEASRVLEGIREKQPEVWRLITDDGRYNLAWPTARSPVLDMEPC